MKPNTLEDELEDIIGKASRGQQIRIKSNPNNLSPTELEAIAEELGLHAPSLTKLNAPFSPAALPAEVTMVTSSFGHLGVNAFLIINKGKRILIDTGTEPDLVSGLNPDCVLITHRHPDHVACEASFSSPIMSPNHPDADLLNQLDIKTFDVSGHFTPSLAYYFPNLGVCAVGDAIFKRSIGGCHGKKNYQMALKNNRTLLSSIPKETILLVGHGPNTTVDNELKENPFLAVS